MRELEVTCPLPAQLDFDGALRTGQALSNLPMANSYRFDFSRIKFYEPFGMLYLAALLRQFRNMRKQSRFFADGYEGQGYPAFMCFFQAFGLKVGNVPGTLQGNSQYIPITNLSVSDLRLEATRTYEDEQETIEKKSSQLASVLIRQANVPLHDTLSYSLREIFRNVTEHSKAEEIWYAAQYWQENGWVELCILDEGVGIRATLERNPHLTIQSDIDALRLAILPGISGSAFRGGRKQRNNIWANSGYGLFMTCQLCQKGGSFAILSGNTGILIENDRQTQVESNFRGTAIRLKFFVPKIAELNDSLEDLRNRGALIAGTLKQAANVTASMSSRMLIGKNKK